MLNFVLWLVFPAISLIHLVVLCAGKAPPPPTRVPSQKEVQQSSSSLSSNKAREPPRRNADSIVPKKHELNEKEALIKQGLQTTKHAYPTLEDIKSDWSDKDDKDKKGKKKEAKASERKKVDEKDKKKEEEVKEKGHLISVQRGGEKEDKSVSVGLLASAHGLPLPGTI